MRAVLQIAVTVIVFPVQKQSNIPAVRITAKPVPVRQIRHAAITEAVPFAHRI